MICALFLFGCIPVIFLVRGLNAEAKSLRLCNYSFALGFCFMFAPEIAFYAPRDLPELFRIAGSIRIAMATAGILLAFWARRIGKRDRGIAPSRPYWALGTCLLLMITAVPHFVLTSSRYLLPKEGDPHSGAFVHRISDSNSEVTFPTGHWKQLPNDNMGVKFSHPDPKMIFWITAANPLKEKEAAEKMKEVEARMRKDPTTAAGTFQLRDRPNGNWHVRSLSWVTEVSKGRAVYNCVGLCWNKSNQQYLMLLFEGQFSMRPERMEAELAVFKDSYRSISDSLRELDDDKTRAKGDD